MAVKNPKRPDELVKSMDQFANELMTLARNPAKEGEEPISLVTKGDIFKLVTGWVAVKNRIGQDGEGDELDGFRRRLRGVTDQSDQRKAGAGRRGVPATKPDASKPAFGRPLNNGGSALAAVGRDVPGPNAGDDAGAGDGAEC